MQAHPLRLEKNQMLQGDKIQLLHLLQHPHITQLVGTYVCSSALAILLYPVVDFTLGVFIKGCLNSESTKRDQKSYYLMRFIVEMVYL
jgi:hypothetical protein